MMRAMKKNKAWKKQGMLRAIETAPGMSEQGPEWSKAAQLQVSAGRKSQQEGEGRAKATGSSGDDGGHWRPLDLKQVSQDGRRDPCRVL